MTTTAKMINRDWQQITDGTQSALVQIFGSADVCDSQVKPGEELAAHSFSNAVLLQPPEGGEGYPVNAVINSAVKLIQSGIDGKT
ncbi:TPA_asm: hypothetical protein G0G78_25595, partial [Salmonella enterica]|nr:hypothetical protein [Salmonella enterica]HAC8273326.1 hypothetical protein [Salmonella enterica]